MTWSKGTLTVVFQSLTGGKCSREIRADMMRGLAVHDALGVSTMDQVPVFSISHVATGRKVATSYFDDPRKAMTAVTALVALPVDWTALNPAGSVDPVDRQFLRQALDAVCNFCGAFEIETPMDRPGGHA